MRLMNKSTSQTNNLLSNSSTTTATNTTSTLSHLNNTRGSNGSSGNNKKIIVNLNPLKLNGNGELVAKQLSDDASLNIFHPAKFCKIPLVALAYSTALYALLVYGFVTGISIYQLVINKEFRLSLPLYILIAGYSGITLMSAFLLISIYKNWLSVVLSWIVIVTVFILPEISLNILFAETLLNWFSTNYGVFTIAYLILRISLNIPCIIFVFMYYVHKVKREKHLKRILMPIRKNIVNGETLKRYQDITIDNTLVSFKQTGDQQSMYRFVPQSMYKNDDEVNLLHEVPIQRAATGQKLDYTNSLHLKWDGNGPKVLDKISEHIQEEHIQQFPSPIEISYKTPNQQGLEQDSQNQQRNPNSQPFSHKPFHNSTLIAQYDKLLDSLHRHNVSKNRPPIINTSTATIEDKDKDGSFGGAVVARVSNSCNCVNISTCTPKVANDDTIATEQLIIHSSNCNQRLK